MIVSDCVLYEKDDFSVSNLQKNQFAKLKTLIMADLKKKSQLIMLSIIGARNLIELGLLRIRHFKKLERRSVEIFIDLIKSNPKLKILYVPLVATDIFLAEVSKDARLICF